MQQVNILVASEVAGSLDPFEHGRTHFVFTLLPFRDPPRLLEGPVLAFIDWKGSEIDGRKLCRQLRSDFRTKNAHITTVHEKLTEEVQAASQEVGADACMEGPLNRRIILDRVLTFAPFCTDKFAQDVIAMGRLTMDLSAWRARWDGRPIELTAHEFRVLRYFAENANRVLTRDELLLGLGDTTSQSDLRSVDAWVARLRQANCHGYNRCESNRN